MSVVIKSRQVKFRNTGSDNYHGISAISEEKTTDMLQQIEQKGQDVIDSIPDDYTGLTESVAAIAPEFESKSYSKGDLVFHENTLYQAKTDVYPMTLNGQPYWPFGSFEEVTIDKVINGDIKNLIAKKFVNGESWIREVGSYVVYGNELYRVIEANSDTIWSASKYTKITSLSKEIESIKSSIQNILTRLTALENA